MIRCIPQIELIEDGSNECPLIQISGTDFQAARELFHAIRGMRDKMAGSFVLHDVPGFENCTDPELQLTISEDNDGIQNLAGGRTYECRLSYDGWRRVEDLLAPFCQRNSALQGFQWLDETSNISLLFSPNSGW